MQKGKPLKNNAEQNKSNLKTTKEFPSIHFLTTTKTLLFLLTLAPGGITTWLSFLYLGVRIRSFRYILWSVFYLIFFIVSIHLASHPPNSHSPLILSILVIWIMGPIHMFKYGFRWINLYGDYEPQSSIKLYRNSSNQRPRKSNTSISPNSPAVTKDILSQDSSDSIPTNPLPVSNQSIKNNQEISSQKETTLSLGSQNSPQNSKHKELLNEPFFPSSLKKKLPPISPIPSMVQPVSTTVPSNKVNDNYSDPNKTSKDKNPPTVQSVVRQNNDLDFEQKNFPVSNQDIIESYFSPSDFVNSNTINNLLSNPKSPTSNYKNLFKSLANSSTWSRTDFAQVVVENGLAAKDAIQNLNKISIESLAKPLCVEDAATIKIDVAAAMALANNYP